MKCCLSDLRYKEVIDLTTGQRLGYVCDAEIDLEEGKIVSLIVPGQKKLGGLLSGDGGPESKGKGCVCDAPPEGAHFQPQGGAARHRCHESGRAQGLFHP